MNPKRANEKSNHEPERCVGMITKTIRHTRSSLRMPARLLRSPTRIRQPGPSYLAIEDITRRQFLIGAGSLLVLAPYGCGGGTESDEGGPTVSGESRTVEHGLGTSEVPAEASRIVAIGAEVAEVGLALGIKPVAVDGYAATYPYLDLGGVTTVGELGALNLEAIANTDPDLIISLDEIIEGTYEELYQIAPAIAVSSLDGTTVQWQDYGRDLAAAFAARRGTRRYDELLSAYEERAGEIKQTLSEGGPAPTVAILRGDEAENQRFDLPGIFFGSVVYHDVGLPLPPELREPAEAGEPFLRVSTEEFSRGDADAIFVYGGVGEESGERQASERVEALREEPLFSRLKAVESGNVYPVGAHWFSGNITAARLILDDLEEHLIKGGSTT